MNVRKLTISALLTALALALSYVERFIPLNLLVPLPGIKLGLANVVTLFSLFSLGPGYALGILISRCLLGALFGGSVSSLFFSLSGGILAFIVMLVSMKLRIFSVFGVSVLGAAAHNTGQILAATILMDSTALWGYLPLLLLTACFTGIITALMAQAVIRTVPSSVISGKTT